MKYIRYLLLLFPLSCVVVFFWYILAWNTNTNRGMDFFEDLYPLGACAIISIYLYIKRKRRFFLAALIVNILAMVFFYCIDKYNVMVDYEKWLERGMPSRFSQEPSSTIVTKEEMRQREKSARKRKEELKERDNE